MEGEDAAMGPFERYAQVSGLRLHFLEWPGQDPPLLLVHGSSFNAWMWAPVAEALAPARVLAVDVRGHGDTIAPQGLGFRDWRSYGLDIAQLIASLGLERLTLVGHSAGGAWSIHAAAQVPERVSALVLVDPVLYAPADPGAGPGGGSTLGMVERALRRRGSWTGRTEAKEYFRQRVPYSRFHPKVFERFVSTCLRPSPDGGLELKCTPAVEAEMYAGQDTNSASSFLTGFRFPVLIVEAAETNIFTPERASAIVGQMPLARRKRIPASTHFVPFERPQDVAAALRDFHQDIARGTAVPAPRG